jgi:hypothetical protein
MGMNAAESYFSDFVQAGLNALAVTLVASIIALVATRIPRVRKWFVEARVVLVVSFVMSVIVAGITGVLLRHLTWQELSGFSIVRAGRIDPTKVVDKSCETDERGFGVAKVKDKKGTDIDGEYIVCFDSLLPPNSFIIVSPILNEMEDDANTVSVNVVNTYGRSFKARTRLNGQPTDEAFWFIVLRGRGDL